MRREELHQKEHSSVITRIHGEKETKYSETQMKPLKIN